MLRDVCNAWKRAPITVSTMHVQLKLTAASSSQIQSLLLSDNGLLHNIPDLLETFDATMTHCLVLSSLLDTFILKIKKGTLEGTEPDWQVKFNTVWHENEVKELLSQLSTAQGGMSMLMNLLQM
jgi:hypothetical protein